LPIFFGQITRHQKADFTSTTDDLVHVARWHPLQIWLIWPMRAPVGQTSMIAEMDDSTPMARICFGPNNPTLSHSKL